MIDPSLSTLEGGISPSSHFKVAPEPTPANPKIGSSIRVFYSWRHARNSGFLPRNEWLRKGRKVSKDAHLAAICVPEGRLLKGEDLLTHIDRRQMDRQFEGRQIHQVFSAEQTQPYRPTPRTIAHQIYWAYFGHLARRDQYAD